MLIAFQQNNSSNGAVPDPSFFVKGLARETSLDHETRAETGAYEPPKASKEHATTMYTWVPSKYKFNIRNIYIYCIVVSVMQLHLHMHKILVS